MSRAKALARAASNRVNMLLAQRAPSVAPLVIVTGYPKSGTTWACQLAADYMDLPFPRFNLFPTACPAVIHGHGVPKRSWPNGIYIVRDFRDVMVSLYFHMVREIRAHSGEGPIRVPGHLRGHFSGAEDLDDSRANLPSFIRAEMRRPHSSPVTWAEHVEAAYALDHPRLGRIRYEQLLAKDAAGLAAELARVEQADPDEQKAAAALDRRMFRRQASRTGQLARKGIAGDWMNHFTVETARLVDEVAGSALIAAGYEADRGWVERFAQRSVGEGAGDDASVPVGGESGAA